MKAKELVKVFSKLNPEEEVWVTWISKDEITEKVEELIDNLDEDEVDENDPITAESIVTDSFCESVFDSINNDDYLWERFSENYQDILTELVNKELHEVKEDTKLWDTETEKSNES